MTRTRKLGLFGFGCVGQGLYDLLQQADDDSLSIARICVKHRDKARKIAQENFVYDAALILDDPEIDIIVEVIDNAGEAFDIVAEALKRGKAVVTANKQMIADRAADLLALQEQYGAPLLYEASACGSIPIIRLLESYYADVKLKALGGIFNGSSNFILTRMTQGGLSYAEALERAQVLGFAESDPEVDVAGIDARNKLSILALHAFGQILPGEHSYTRGIQSVSQADIQYAAGRRLKIKPVALVRLIGGRPIGWVMPQLIPAGHILYDVENEFNAVLLETESGNRQLLEGKGAGSHPTGSAVLADVRALQRTYSYAYANRSRRDAYSPAVPELLVELYLRFPQEHDPQLAFHSVKERHEGPGETRIIGTVRFADLLASPGLEHPAVFVARTSRAIVELAVEAVPV